MSITDRMTLALARCIRRKVMDAWSTFRSYRESLRFSLYTFSYTSIRAKADEFMVKSTRQVR